MEGGREGGREEGDGEKGRESSNAFTRHLIRIVICSACTSLC